MKKTLYYAIPAIAVILSWFRVIPPIIAILIVISVLPKFIAGWRLERDRAAKLKRLEEEFKEPRVFTFPHVPDIVLRPDEVETPDIEWRDRADGEYIPAFGCTSRDEARRLGQYILRVDLGQNDALEQSEESMITLRGLNGEERRIPVRTYSDGMMVYDLTWRHDFKRKPKYNKPTCRYFSNNSYLPCAVNCATGCDECKAFEERL